MSRLYPIHRIWCWLLLFILGEALALKGRIFEPLGARLVGVTIQSDPSTWWFDVLFVVPMGLLARFAAAKVIWLAREINQDRPARPDPVDRSAMTTRSP
ncbi:MAG: hypothetical protein KKA73_01640 [Chloroflexi bacterium]|nr:hypothetical protein [Chloroflexota bacterium]MBU1746367.1 hypothetical protein [Chloroflexota bacterium]